MLHRISKIALCMLTLFGACHHNRGKPASPNPPLSSAPQSAPASMANPVSTSIQKSETRRITVTRTHDGHSASGMVLLREPVASDATGSPHMKLAGARAWVALGEQRIAADDWPGAIACGRAGLEELGRRYAGRGALDHTQMKLSVAEDQIKEGDLVNAAKNILRQLTIRIAYYVDLHADAIAE